jgi:nucleotide-binding universal stress UspA family protein
MEKILVAMDSARSHLLAAIHALSLAKRIKAKVLFLLIFPSPPGGLGQPAGNKNEIASKKRVEALIEEARADGVAIDYYLAYGDYESELLSFVQENRVTLLVIESTAGSGHVPEATKEFIDKLRHRINCRIEVVNEKQESLQRKE